MADNFYRTFFAVFSWAVALVSLWSGADLIISAILGSPEKEDEKLPQMMGATIFLFIGGVFAVIAYGILK